MKLWDFMGMRLGSFVEDGQFFMLFMVALLLLWLMQDKNRREFIQFAFVMLLLLLCPISAKLFMIYQTQFFSYEDLWELLPVTGLLAYALVLASNKIKMIYIKDYGHWEEAVPRKKEIGYEVLMTVILAALLFLCGTLTPAKAMTERTQGVERIPVEAEEVLSLLEIPKGENITVLSPDEIATWARIYSGDIILPYGRNMWEIALNAYTYDTYSQDLTDLHDWINGELEVLEILIAENKGEAGADTGTVLADAANGEAAVSAEAVRTEEAYLSYCASCGYDYLVFSEARLDGDMGATLQKALAKQTDYAVFATQGGYTIYKLQ